MDNDLAQTTEEINELNSAHVTYEELLVKEIESLVGLAYAHGWKSSLHNEGINCRNRIAQAQIKLGLEVSYTK